MNIFRRTARKPAAGVSRARRLRMEPVESRLMLSGGAALDIVSLFDNAEHVTGGGLWVQVAGDYDSNASGDIIILAPTAQNFGGGFDFDLPDSVNLGVDGFHTLDEGFRLYLPGFREAAPISPAAPPGGHPEENAGEAAPIAMAAWLDTDSGKATPEAAMPVRTLPAPVVEDGLLIAGVGQASNEQRISTPREPLHNDAELHRMWAFDLAPLSVAQESALSDTVQTNGEADEVATAPVRDRQVELPSNFEGATKRLVSTGEARDDVSLPPSSDESSPELAAHDFAFSEYHNRQAVDIEPWNAPLDRRNMAAATLAALLVAHRTRRDEAEPIACNPSDPHEQHEPTH